MPTETIDIKIEDGVCDAYLAYPAGGKYPGVLFFMDGIVMRPVIHRMADRIAANGYVVLAPHMFYRAGRAPVFDSVSILQPENRPKLAELIGALTPERVVSDAGAFLKALFARPEIAPGIKVGLTGYCMGGAMVMRTGAAYPDRVGAGASFHEGALPPPRLTVRIC
jgi:carboxymethylenebutenolidase